LGVVPVSKRKPDRARQINFQEEINSRKKLAIMEENKKNKSSEKDGKSTDFGRRDLLKGLATLPVLGALAYGVYKKKNYDRLVNNNLRQAVDLSAESPVMFSSNQMNPVIRLGIIGYGIRGPHLLRAAGFAMPSELEDWKQNNLKNPSDHRLEDFLSQENLNVKITAVCDLFDVNVKRALSAAANADKSGNNGTFVQTAKSYKNYKELLSSGEVDAVIIATPDHWHTDIAIEAIKNGVHVYSEKGMTRTVEEAFRLREAVKNGKVVFQLGHQGRQTESHAKAREAIEKNIIGKVGLIEVCTNRNSPNGAWVYDIHPDGNPQTIDWEQFEFPCETKHPFSPERFFRWRCWWDYGTGLGGDLLTHEFDAINQIMNLGIPESAVSSGGVYFFKDKAAGHYVNEAREVPDIWQVALEYPKRDLTLLYSATLASNKERGKMIMGHDGYMELSDSLTIYADRESDKYKEKIQSKVINPELPIYTYIPGRNNVDAIASPTEKYFASRGLLYTYRDGKRVDTTHLHVKEWIDCIRESMAQGKLIQPSCNIDQGFEEAISAHMATISYREKRKVFWDAEREAVV
jgi:predicted dehydrogenase